MTYLIKLSLISFHNKIFHFKQLDFDDAQPRTNQLNQAGVKPYLKTCGPYAFLRKLDSLLILVLAM